MTYLHVTHHVAHAVHVNNKLYHVINIQVKSVYLVTRLTRKKSKNKWWESILDISYALQESKKKKNIYIYQGSEGRGFLYFVRKIIQ